MIDSGLQLTTHSWDVKLVTKCADKFMYTLPLSLQPVNKMVARSKQTWFTLCTVPVVNTSNKSWFDIATNMIIGATNLITVNTL